MSSTPQPTTNPPLQLPTTLNPDAFDVLSELANLLTRLRTLPALPSSSGTTTGTGGVTGTPVPRAGSTPAQATSTPTPTASSATTTGGKRTDLTLKEIPVATDTLRHRFQRARALIKTQLPDLDRGIPDQEVEIRALEARIERQRDTLFKLRDVGARLGIETGQGEGDRMEE
ncbi:RNA polymerase II transcription mediator complex subunit 9-domain-containing protein [Xylariaceae sp. FL0255]|nr:RNA polymerase II transcription mediator complex subunit 9-domain-containing protein [Xylariaceae sp. FL0255]